MTNFVKWANVKGVPVWNTFGNIETRFEIYEDNGGGLHCAVFDEKGACIEIFTGLEFYENGVFALLEAFLDDPDVNHIDWGCGFYERTEQYSLDLQDVYNEGLGDLVGDNDGVSIDANFIP